MFLQNLHAGYESIIVDDLKVVGAMFSITRITVIRRWRPVAGTADSYCPVRDMRDG